MSDECPFCSFEDRNDEWILPKTGLFMAIYAGMPESMGHALLIPRRHVVDLHELEPCEWTALQPLLTELKSILDREYAPIGHVIRIKVGECGTVSHFHVHVIPQYQEEEK
ncbi:MAG: HIT family protein [Patescibacteria group bacterium]|nr:HIT family protein [Patescibacteria group bacterium]